MKKLSQKWCVVGLFSDIDEGFTFKPKDWPLHVTLAPTFAVNCSGEILINRLEPILNNQSVLVDCVDDVKWGNLEVVLVQKTNRLIMLHENIIRSLEPNGLEFNEPQYVGKNYKPHITLQENEKVKVGDKLSIRNIALIDMFPGSDAKKRRIIKLYSHN